MLDFPAGDNDMSRVSAGVAAVVPERTLEELSDRPGSPPSARPRASEDRRARAMHGRRSRVEISE